MDIQKLIIGSLLDKYKKENTTDPVSVDAQKLALKMQGMMNINNPLGALAKIDATNVAPTPTDGVASALGAVAGADPLMAGLSMYGNYMGNIVNNGKQAISAAANFFEPLAGEQIDPDKALAFGAATGAASGFAQNGIKGLLMGGVKGGLTSWFKSMQADEQRIMDDFTEFTEDTALSNTFKNRSLYAAKGGAIMTEGIDPRLITMDVTPVQTELGETFMRPDGTVYEVAAKKKHKDRNKEDISDFLPKDGYVFSAKYFVSKKDAEKIPIGETVPIYSEDGKPKKEATVIYLSEYYKDNEDRLSMADISLRVRKAFPLSSRVQGDQFAEKAKEDNLRSRNNILGILMALNEEKRMKEELREKERELQKLVDTQVDVPMTEEEMVEQEQMMMNEEPSEEEMPEEEEYEEGEEIPMFARGGFVEEIFRKQKARKMAKGGDPKKDPKWQQVLDAIAARDYPKKINPIDKIDFTKYPFKTGNVWDDEDQIPEYPRNVEVKEKTDEQKKREEDWLYNTFPIEDSFDDVVIKAPRWNKKPEPPITNPPYQGAPDNSGVTPLPRKSNDPKDRLPGDGSFKDSTTKTSTEDYQDWKEGPEGEPSWIEQKLMEMAKDDPNSELNKYLKRIPRAYDKASMLHTAAAMPAIMGSLLQKSEDFIPGDRTYIDALDESVPQYMKDANVSNSILAYRNAIRNNPLMSESAKAGMFSAVSQAGVGFANKDLQLKNEKILRANEFVNRERIRYQNWLTDKRTLENQKVSDVGSIMANTLSGAGDRVLSKLQAQIAGSVAQINLENNRLALEYAKEKLEDKKDDDKKDDDKGDYKPPPKYEVKEDPAKTDNGSTSTTQGTTNAPAATTKVNTTTTVEPDILKSYLKGNQGQGIDDVKNMPTDIPPLTDFGIVSPVNPNDYISDRNYEYNRGIKRAVYESTSGLYDGTGHPNFGFNDPSIPNFKNAEEASIAQIPYYDKAHKKLPKGSIFEIDAMVDLDFNAGRDARIYAYQEYLRATDPQNTTKWQDERGHYKDRIELSKQMTPEFEAEYEKVFSNLSEEDRVKYLNAGREMYYKNTFKDDAILGKGKGYWEKSATLPAGAGPNDWVKQGDWYYKRNPDDGSLSPMWKKTWQGRLKKRGGFVTPQVADELNVMEMYGNTGLKIMAKGGDVEPNATVISPKFSLRSSASTNESEELLRLRDQYKALERESHLTWQRLSEAQGKPEADDLKQNYYLLKAEMNKIEDSYKNHKDNPRVEVDVISNVAEHIARKKGKTKKMAKGGPVIETVEKNTFNIKSGNTGNKELDLLSEMYADEYRKYILALREYNGIRNIDKDKAATLYGLMEEYNNNMKINEKAFNAHPDNPLKKVKALVTRSK